MIFLMILWGVIMKRFVEGADRGQSTLLPECLDDWIDEENPVRAVDAFVDALDLKDLGFDGVEPAATGGSPVVMGTQIKHALDPEPSSMTHHTSSPYAC